MSTHTRVFGALAFSAAALVAAPSTATATPATVTLACRAKVASSTQPFALKPTLEVEAPASVARGASFTERVKVAPVAIPTRVGSFTIDQVRAITVRYRVGGGAKVVKASLAGSGATAAVARGTVTVTVPGPLAGGGQLALPDLVLDLKATGKVGASIGTLVGGSSFAKSALSATVHVGGSAPLDVPASCTAKPKGQQLASVKITEAARGGGSGHKPGGHHKPKPGSGHKPGGHHKPKPGSGHKPGGHHKPKPGSGHKPGGHHKPKPGSGHKPSGHGHKPGGHHKPGHHKPGGHGHKPGHGPWAGHGPGPGQSPAPDPGPDPQSP